MYDAVSLSAFLISRSGIIVVVAVPLAIFTLSGLDEPVSLPLSLMVTPFNLKIRFPSLTFLLLASVTVALSVNFSPITPLTVDTVVFVLILFFTVILVVAVMLLYLLFPLFVYLFLLVYIFVLLLRYYQFLSYSFCR